MTINLDRWLEPDALLMVAAMNGAAIFGATQPLEPWTKGDPVIVWAIMATSALLLLGYRKVVLS